MSRSPLLVFVAVAACGPKPPPADPLPDDLTTRQVAPARAPHSEIERRRDAACEALGPRLTACAIDDARATMSAEELAKLDIEKTAPVHTQKFIEACKGQTLSSRQVRVYEVCIREETACEPLEACLDNARPDAASQ
ncbi:MAG: hypothetical protein R3B06_19525 [Kofleriaceae bacterium]